MSPLLAAACGALLVAGIIGLGLGLRRVPVVERSPSRRLATLRRVTPRTRLLLLVGLITGALGWMLTGWPLALAIGPVAAVGLPYLLATSPAKERIARLEALEEWARSLSGVLTVGVGLEQALIATLRSTPAPILGEVGRLAARLRARWRTGDALRAFADELDDTTGDLVAANLILGSRRRGAGLSAVLDSLAESVASDVRARRQVEADRAKPRATARWVTIISATVLVVLALSGSYVEPFATPVGQVILTLLLAAYAALLVWLRKMAEGKPPPRIFGKARQLGRVSGGTS